MNTLNTNDFLYDTGLGLFPLPNFMSQVETSVWRRPREPDFRFRDRTYGSDEELKLMLMREGLALGRTNRSWWGTKVWRESNGYYEDPVYRNVWPDWDLSELRLVVAMTKPAMSYDRRKTYFFESSHLEYRGERISQTMLTEWVQKQVLEEAELRLAVMGFRFSKEPFETKRTSRGDVERYWLIPPDLELGKLPFRVRESDATYLVEEDGHFALLGDRNYVMKAMAAFGIRAELPPDPDFADAERDGIS